MVESSTSRTMGFGVGGLAIVFLVAVLTWTVVHQIAYQRQADCAWVPRGVAMAEQVGVDVPL